VPPPSPDVLHVDLKAVEPATMIDGGDHHDLEQLEKCEARERQAGREDFDAGFRRLRVRRLDGGLPLSATKPRGKRVGSIQRISKQKRLDSALGTIPEPSALQRFPESLRERALTLQLDSIDTLET
jgi:hypothetical protein